jgi:hypothetical protein
MYETSFLLRIWYFSSFFSICMLGKFCLILVVKQIQIDEQLQTQLSF